MNSWIILSQLTNQAIPFLDFLVKQLIRSFDTQSNHSALINFYIKMGNEACGCNRGRRNGYSTEVNTSIVFKPTVIQEEWTNAVKNNTVAIVEALHLNNRELVDLPIDTHNFCAIHYAAKYKKYDLLDYLLDNHFDINRQETQYGNTALHFAAQNEDTKAIAKLFSYHDIDDKIKNYEGKEPCHMFADHFKRDYIKTKERGKAIENKIRNEMMKHKTAFGVTVYPTEYIEYLTRNNGFKTYNVLNGSYRTKGKYLTKFALENGVDLDEMGMYLEQNVNKGIWHKLTKKEQIKKEGDTERVLIGICKLTMRDKHKEQSGKKRGYNERPSKESIQQLNKSICNMIRQNNGKITLNQVDFEQNFPKYLYTVHQQIMNDES
eukprot:418990_1